MSVEDDSGEHTAPISDCEGTGAWALNAGAGRKWEGGQGYPDRDKGPYPRLPGRGLWGNVRVSMPCRGAERVTNAKVPHRLSGLLLPWLLVPADLQALPRLP